jgi:hypothetical protein
VAPEETAVARQRLDKHLAAALDMHATIEELLEALFSVWFVPKLYSESHQEKLVSHG